MRFLLFPLVLFALLTPALAQDEDDNPYIVKDSMYFTMKDGVMTKEEMEEEARYVHDQCTKGLYQNRFFDCGCIAGAFLREREKRGPLALQTTILTELYRGGGSLAKCGNTATIAGTMFADCMMYADAFRRLETNNEQYCQCAGNRIARDFSDYPFLGTDYIERLRVQAMVTCNRQFPAVRQNY